MESKLDKVQRLSRGMVHCTNMIDMYKYILDWIDDNDASHVHIGDTDYGSNVWLTFLGYNDEVVHELEYENLNTEFEGASFLSVKDIEDRIQELDLEENNIMAEFKEVFCAH